MPIPTKPDSTPPGTPFPSTLLDELEEALLSLEGDDRLRIQTHYFDTPVPDEPDADTLDTLHRLGRQVAYDLNETQLHFFLAGLGARRRVKRRVAMNRGDYLRLGTDIYVLDRVPDEPGVFSVRDLDPSSFYGVARKHGDTSLHIELSNYSFDGTMNALDLIVSSGKIRIKMRADMERDKPLESKRDRPSRSQRFARTPLGTLHAYPSGSFKFDSQKASPDRSSQDDLAAKARLFIQITESAPVSIPPN